MKHGFTLIELLVVVLIIGILAAIALPQYKKAVERAKIAEAVTNLRAIANANQVYYMTNGVYAQVEEMDKLDVQIPGQIASISGTNRIATKDWIYSPADGAGEHIALAHRADNGVWRGMSKGYHLHIDQSNLNQIKCGYFTQTPEMEKKLCAQINANGTL